METTMNTMTTTRKVLAIAFTTVTLAVGFLAATTAADARYVCNWTPRGTFCVWAP
jgi:hypothetical protein